MHLSSQEEDSKLHYLFPAEVIPWMPVLGSLKAWRSHGKDLETNWHFFPETLEQLNFGERIGYDVRGMLGFQLSLAYHWQK